MYNHSTPSHDLTLPCTSCCGLVVTQNLISIIREIDRDVMEGRDVKNKQSSFKNMTELMCVYVWVTKMVTIVVSQLSFIHASLGNDDNCKNVAPKKKKKEETILEKHVDAHSHSETKRMTQ